MAEVVGLVLGVLLLLLSAAENYKRCFRPFTTYRSFSKHAAKFERRLEIQRTIFENQCQLLLEEVTGHGLAAEMLLDKGHSKWTDQDLNGQLDDQLLSSRTSCTTILNEINDVLQKLEKWVETMEGAIKNEEKSLTARSKPWRYLVKRKVKYCLSEPDLIRSLSELKELNDSFMTLSSQTSKLQTKRGERVSCPQDLEKGLCELLAIQNVSCSIHKALKMSCSKHTTHRSQLYLTAKLRTDSCVPSIQFKISFDRFAPKFAVPSKSSFFVIESTVPSHWIRSLTSDKLGQKRAARTASEICSTKRVKVSVKRKDKGLIESANQASRVMINNNSTGSESFLHTAHEIQLTELGTNGNFCDQLRSHLHKRSLLGGHSIGVLGEQEGSEHLVRVLPESTPRNNLAVTLEAIVRRSSCQNPSNRLSRLDRLTVARSLATAVLQFFGTPWLNLNQPWTSKDIWFFDAQKTETPQNGSTLSEPYIDVAVEDAIENEKRTFHTSDLAANPACSALQLF